MNMSHDHLIFLLEHLVLLFDNSIPDVWNSYMQHRSHLNISFQLLKPSFSVCYLMFMKFSNKSHNMKAWIILSYSLFLLLYLYRENEFFFLGGGHVCHFEVFFREKTPPVERELICNETLLQNYPCPI